MRVSNAPTITYRIWIAGDYADAVRTVREFCQEGACFAVQPTDYIYTGGMESGVCVTLINYPRFPSNPGELFGKAKRLADLLQERLFQDSFTIEGPDNTVWFTTREGV